MLPLPGFRPNEDNSDRRVPNVVVPDFLANRGRLDVRVVNVADLHGAIDNAFAHHAHEPVLVLDIVLMEADENLVARRRCHLENLSMGMP